MLLLHRSHSDFYSGTDRIFSGFGKSKSVSQRKGVFGRALVSFYFWLDDYFACFSLCVGLFSLVMVIYLFNNRMDSTAKLTWMLILSVVPIPGAILLWFTQTNAGHRWIKRRVEELIDETRTAIAQDADVLTSLAEDHSGTDDLSTYLNRSVGRTPR